MNNINNQPLWIKVLLVCFFAVCLLFSVGQVVKYIYYFLFGKIIEGTVTQTELRLGAPGISYIPTVEYEASGTLYEFTSKISGNYRTGKTVKVVYLKNKPEKAVVIGFAPLFMILVSLFLAYVLYIGFISFLI